MATQVVFHPFVPAVSHKGRAGRWNVLRSVALLIGLFLCSIPARAQLQQPFVFSANPVNPKSVAVYTRNDLTGILTPVPGSPFPSKEPVNVMTLDFKGRFLFTASSNPSTISMFSVDPNTGALQEVPNSPFASLSTNDPVFLSTESSGQFLYVINFNGAQAGASSVESFQIDAVNLALIPSASGATQLPGLFLTGATHPSGNSFYAFLNAPLSSTPNQAFFLLFNSSTGQFTIPNPNIGSSIGTFGCCFALDPQGKSLAFETGQLTLYSLLADGTLAPNPATGSSNAALSMAFDTFGRFLYVDSPIPQTNSTSVHIISPATLLETSNSPLPSSFPAPGTWIVDPTAPLLYADQVYQVDPQTGIPSSILSTSPITKPAVFSKPPGSQPVVGPIALLSATSLSFGSLSLGQISSALTLTITSNGGQALSLNTVAITGQNAGDFAITGDTCHAPTVLQPGNSCSVLVSFTPSATGSRTAAVTITSNASPPTESAQLSGVGLTPAPAVTIVPGSLDFGAVTQGTSASLNVSVKNSGTATLHITSVVLGGANVNDYSSSSPTCSSAIAVNSTCTIIVTFTPLASGLRSATVTITDDAPDSPQTLALSGTGVSSAPAVTLIPASLDFGSVTQGTSTSLNFSVKNSGTAALQITSIVLGGTNANDFNSSSPTCNLPIAVNSTCTVIVAFTPLAPGVLSATVTISDDAPSSPQTLSLSGTGVAPVAAITFSPTVPSFPTITEGTSGAAQTLTVISSGTAPLHVSSVSLRGPNPSDFSFTNNCTAPVAPAANCAISLVFNPIGTGQRAANLTITDDAPGSPQLVSLAATANPAFAAGAAPNGSTTASVSAGQTAQYLLQLTPGAGYSGTVSLACGGAPLGAACQFPASVSLANGNPAPFTVTVTTSGSAMLPPATLRRLVPPTGIPMLLLLALALILVRAIKNRWMFESAAGARHLAWSGALAVVFLCSVFYAAGCGGGSSTVTPAPVTPPSVVTPSGTSTITITPTAMSSSGQPLQLQAIPLTLTVK